MPILNIYETLKTQNEDSADYYKNIKFYNGNNLEGYHFLLYIFKSPVLNNFISFNNWPDSFSSRHIFLKSIKKRESYLNMNIMIRITDGLSIRSSNAI